MLLAVNRISRDTIREKFQHRRVRNVVRPSVTGILSQFSIRSQNDHCRPMEDKRLSSPECPVTTGSQDVRPKPGAPSSIKL